MWCSGECGAPNNVHCIEVSVRAPMIESSATSVCLDRVRIYLAPVCVWSKSMNRSKHKIFTITKYNGRCTFRNVGTVLRCDTVNWFYTLSNICFLEYSCNVDEYFIVAHKIMWATLYNGH